MKNPKERSTAILVGVAAGAILMALMFMIVFGLHTGIAGGGTGTADCCSICNIRMVNRMESAYQEE